MMIRLLLFTALFLVLRAVPAQDPYLHPYAETITADELKQHVYKLSSAEFAGRYTGSEGQRLAAKFIQEEFRQDGLTPPYRSVTDPYLQEFSLGKCRWAEQSLASGGISFKPRKDFVFLSDPKTIEGTFPAVFGGFGIDDTVYSDYRGMDVRGRVVLVFSGEPKDEDGKYLLSGSTEPSRKAYYGNKSRVAAEKGAEGMVVIARNNMDFKQYIRRNRANLDAPDISYPDSRPPNDFFTLYADINTGARILNTSPHMLRKAMKAMEEGEATQAGRYSGEAAIRAGKTCDGLNTENVIGMVLGTDLADEAVVLVAHYDHLGVRDGKVYYGADDNATGTAAVMEVAEAFVRAAADGYRPRRTLIFMAVSAEEIGLLGSRYYTENPLIPLEKTYACLNIDMIGRVATKLKDTTNYIGGWAYSSEELMDVVRGNNAEWAPGLSDRMEFRKNPRGGSDHYHFARNGIPSVFYFTGIHKDYHAPTDTPDKILYDRMEQIVRAIFGTAWELANSDRRLVMDE